MRFNKQKVLSGVLATGLALSCMVGPAFAAGTSLKDAIKDTQTQVEAGLVFSDVKQGDWYYDAVMDMTKMGLFAGTGGGKFSPNNTMTCGEFLTVVVRYLYNDELQSMGAVPQGVHWADNARLVALDNDIINNNEIDASDLSRNMTRKEMAMVLVRAADANGESKPVQIDSSKVIDYNSIGTYYRSFVIDAISRGLIAGTSADASSHTLTFSPEGVLTRGQAATVLYRLVNQDNRGTVDYEKPSVVPVTPSENQGQSVTWVEGQAHTNIPKVGDVVIKADGTKVTLKIGYGGVLGAGQGVDIWTGYTLNGIALKEGMIFSDISYRPFAKCPVTGEMYHLDDWLAIAMDPSLDPNNKGVYGEYEGERYGYGGWYAWDDIYKEWVWAGPMFT